MADDPGYRLERPALGIPRRDNQALVERVRVCGCRWANVVENEHFKRLLTLVLQQCCPLESDRVGKSSIQGSTAAGMSDEVR